MSAIVIAWGFLYFTGTINNTQTTGDSSSEVIAGMMGFAAKHLWDVCTRDD